MFEIPRDRLDKFKSSFGEIEKIKKA